MALLEGTNVHIYGTPFTHETRALKITRSLVEHDIFDEVVLAGLASPGLPAREEIGPRREVWRLQGGNPSFGGRLGRIAEVLPWMRAVRRTFRDHPVACVNAHALSVLSTAWRIARRHRVPLVYDTHELETEVASARGVRRPIGKAVERALIGKVALVLAVSPGIVDWYREAYGIENVVLARNVPYRRTAPPPKGDRFRERFGLSSDDLIFLYQGILSGGRSIDMLLDVFSGRAGSNKHLVLMGYGAKDEEIRALAEREPNVHLHEPVPPDEVVETTACADVGLCLIEDVSLSYHHALPNKLFEYVSAGLPVVISDLPDMSAAVAEMGCGWKSELTPEAVSALVDGLDRNAVEQKREAALRALGTFGWEYEEERMIEAYRKWVLPACRS